MSSSELEQLKAEVARLSAIVKKQSVLIAKTGQNVLEMQIAEQRNDLSKFSVSSNTQSSKAKKLESIYASADDLNELAGELQSQFETIDDRNVRRIVNSTKTEKSDTIAVLPNLYSEYMDPKEGLFPNTIGEFEALDNISLFKIAKFYELVPISAEALARVQAIIDDDDKGNTSKEVTGSLLANELSNSDLEKELSKYREEEIDDIFNDVARYLGLRSRRGTEIW